VRSFKDVLLGAPMMGVRHGCGNMRDNGVVVMACLMEQCGKGKSGVAVVATLTRESINIDENQCVLQQLVSSIDT